VSPMILARSAGNELVLGGVQAAAAAGGLAGGVLAAFWSGPKRKMSGILFTLAFGFLVNNILFGVGREFFWWSTAAFTGSFLTPVLVSGFYGLWQAKVPPEIQGRVFAARDILVDLPVPMGALIAGPLADQVFEPFIQSGNTLSSNLSWLVGSGPGAGMGLMFVLFGGIGLLVSLSGRLIPDVWDMENRLPDFDAAGPRLA